MTILFVAIVLLVYVQSTKVIINHSYNRGVFDVADLLNVILGPFTLIAIYLHRAVSFFIDPRTPLWKRK